MQGGQLERALAGAVAVVADREVRERPGLASSFSSFLPSACVGGLGADHLEQPFAEHASEWAASNALAWSTMCASARCRVPAGRSSYSLGQRLDRTGDDPAFSASINPAANASRVAGNLSSSFLARCRSRCRAAVVVFVACANHAGVDVAPDVRADLVAVGLDQQPQPQFLESGRGLGSSTKAWRSSSGVIDHNGASANRSNRARQRRREPHHRMPRRRLPGRRRRRRIQSTTYPTLGAEREPQKEFRTVDNPPGCAVDDSRPGEAVALAACSPRR